MESSCRRKGKIREKSGRCRRTKNEFLFYFFFFAAEAISLLFISSRLLAHSSLFMSNEKNPHTHTHILKRNNNNNRAPLSTFSPPLIPRPPSSFPPPLSVFPAPFCQPPRTTFPAPLALVAQCGFYGI